MAEKKVIITQIKSIIGETFKHKRTMEALGLRRINQQVTHVMTPALVGMLRKVNHLISIQ